MQDQYQPEKTVAALLELAIEGWRFQKLFSKALTKLDVSDAARFANQHRFFLRKIDECLGYTGMRLVSIEGQPYDVGVAATPLNLEDFAPTDRLIVDQMVEPIIMTDQGLLRTGTILLRKADQ